MQSCTDNINFKVLSGQIVAFSKLGEQKVFSDFDFSVLNSNEYKEDAVREDIITPILKRLGYEPSGTFRLVRSKVLIHPFVMIGSKKHPVNIIPDYTLYADETPLAIIEAKGPKEQLVNTKHVEQAYSYAIHPEIQVNTYALCNGFELIVYSISQWEPVLKVPISEIEKHWNSVEEALHPRFLLNPQLKNFAPDFGLSLLKAGFKENTEQIFILHHLQFLQRISDTLYTGNTMTILGEIEYIVSLDFSLEMYELLLSKLPDSVAIEIKNALGQAPFTVEVGGKVIISCSGYFDEPVHGHYEDFVPINVHSILDVRYDETVEMNQYKKQTQV